MKVGTDAMILGAYVGEITARGSSQILDIGTGTGVLALMLAQKTKANIDAVEIDESSFRQAKENLDNSSWKNRIKIFHTSIQDFEPENAEKYDLIISNPPYFEHNMKADNESSKYRERSHSRSLNTLGFEELLFQASRLMHKNGSFYLIIPYKAVKTFLVQAAKNGFLLFDRLDVKSEENQEPVRSVLGFAKYDKDISSSEIIIYNNDKTYTQDYIRLTADYYAKDLLKTHLSVHK